MAKNFIHKQKYTHMSIKIFVYIISLHRNQSIIFIIFKISNFFPSGLQINLIMHKDFLIYLNFTTDIISPTHSKFINILSRFYITSKIYQYISNNTSLSL